MKTDKLTKNSLKIDCMKEAERISERLLQIVNRQLKKRGVVVALSGGIDSSAVAALCVRAFGKKNVFGLLMPEADSSPETLGLSRGLAESLGIDYIHEDITPILTALGCYKRRDDAIRKLIPEFTDGWTSKIVLPSILESDSYPVYSVIVASPDGKSQKERLTPSTYLEIVAATNFKQRTRKMLEYYHADRLNYATTGTPNRQEYDQGFFVKLGDGAADVKPIAHLYKTQVYDLAEYLGVPEEICSRPPTTDTYSMPQTQEEFYFSVPYDIFDLCLYGKNYGYSIDEVAEITELTQHQVEQIFKSIEKKRLTTQYLHVPAVLIDKVEEIQL